MSKNNGQLENPERKTKRVSHITRVFSHMLDTGGARLGTWMVGHLMLTSGVPIEELKPVVEERLLSMSRFRSIAVANKSTAGFKELKLEEIDWSYHIKTEFEGEKVSREQLLEYTTNLLDTGMDIKKPLWRIVMFPEMEEGGATMLFLFSHVLSDGIAAIGLLLKLVDDPPIDPTLPLNKQKVNETDSKAIIQKRRKGKGVGTGTKVAVFFSGIRKGLAATMPAHDPPNALKLKAKDVFDEKEYSGKKKYGKSDRISLDEIKEIKNKFKGATVNDILLALLTMTVKGFLEEVEDPILKRKNKVRGSMPVSMRPRNGALLKDNQPRNDWESLTFNLPLRYKNPIDCVWKVKRMIDKEKVSPLLPIQRRMNKVFVRGAPRGMMMQKVIKSTTKGSLMLSNVPGPQRPVHICGRMIEEIDFYSSSVIGTFLGVMSYNNEVSLSVNLDENVPFEPEALVKHWDNAFKALKEMVDEYEGFVPKKLKLK